LAAEQQLDEARVSRQAALQEREVANERAGIAEKREHLAHEQMKAALRPNLVMLRIQDRIGQKFYIENQGIGFAYDITWDYIPPTIPEKAFVSDVGRLSLGFAANMLAPNSREEFFFSYENFQSVGVMFRYRSADGRLFKTHVALKVNGNGAFIHTHYEHTTS
jgi:hypothetical protein